MEWNNGHRERLYHIIEGKWSAEANVDSFERWLADLGIKWAELEDEFADAPTGTVAIWEGPGDEQIDFKMCWVVPDDVAMKLLVLS